LFATSATVAGRIVTLHAGSWRTRESEALTGRGAGPTFGRVRGAGLVADAAAPKDDTTAAAMNAASGPRMRAGMLPSRQRPARQARQRKTGQ
jgi:hypothetical protein